jgi:Transcriptional regulator
MNSNERTKKLLADAVLELSNKKPLSDISVKDITDFCGISRNAFYYHFKDKQELVFWIYTNFHDSTINLSVTDKSHSNTMALLKYMQKYPSFFKQAFSETGQNSFKSELHKSMYRDYEFVIKNSYDSAEIDPEIKRFAAEYTARCSVDAFEMLLSLPHAEAEKYVDIYLSLLVSGLTGTIERLKPA